MSPVTVTATTTFHSSATSAVHQLPTMITKPKVIVTNAAQVLLNGPSGLAAGLPNSLTNGAHTEVKKENSAASFGNYLQCSL